MATFAYGRVSTKEQTTDNQRLEIESAGYKVDYWFADEGISGKTHATQRPKFVAMLDKIREGETLVVTKLDRLGRDAEDVLRTVRMLAEQKIEVVVLQLGKLDLGSSAGKLMLTMLAAVATMERDLLVERTQSGLARAKAEGKTLGRPSKTTQEQRTAMKAKYASGETVSALARLYGVSRASILNVVSD
jgi:DNA invertase Pin-like site-specific DNA recombinase